MLGIHFLHFVLVLILGTHSSVTSAFSYRSWKLTLQRVSTNDLSNFVFHTVCDNWLLCMYIFLVYNVHSKRTSFVENDENMKPIKLHSFRLFDAILNFNLRDAM